MKIKRLILVFLLFKIICLTLKSDSCKYDEPVIIEEKITNNVQIGSYVNGTSISMFELNSSIEQTGDVLSTQINKNIDT